MGSMTNVVQTGLWRPPPPRFDEGVVGDAMRRGVIDCPPDTPARVVAEIMAAHRIHAVVIREDSSSDARDWGIVTHRDIVAATDRDIATASAGDLAARAIATVTPDQTLRAAAKLMISLEVDHLLVVDSGSQPLGVISSWDLAGAVAQR
jgi:CBS domain-containing protein